MGACTAAFRLMDALFMRPLPISDPQRLYVLARPAMGRLLSEDDDRKPGERPVAVLSWDYWTRRFGRDPKAVGRVVRIARKYGVGSDIFDIVGVTAEGFKGRSQSPRSGA